MIAGVSLFTENGTLLFTDYNKLTRRLLIAAIHQKIARLRPNEHRVDSVSHTVNSVGEGESGDGHGN